VGLAGRDLKPITGEGSRLQSATRASDRIRRLTKREFQNFGITLNSLAPASIDIGLIYNVDWHLENEDSMESVRTRALPKVAETANRSSSARKARGSSRHDVKALLRSVGLRPTRQRVELGQLLFGNGNRHITAEALHLEAMDAKVPVSLATVYNTLNQFTNVGILRQLAFDGSKSFFDTNTSTHHHFFIEDENSLIDIAPYDLALAEIPKPPEGYEITRVDLSIRLRAKEP
jgi:Fur family transcriptional regulator, iron response regulator